MKCKWRANVCEALPPLASFNGRVGERFMPLVCKTSTPKAESVERFRPSSVVGSNPTPSAKLVMRTNLYRFSLVFARFVPVRGFALGTNPRFAFGADPRHPFVGTTATFVAFLLDRNQSHTGIILDKYILSREESMK